MTRGPGGGDGRTERGGCADDRDIIARIIHADRYVVESIPECSLLSAPPAREKPLLTIFSPAMNWRHGLWIRRRA